MTRKEFDQILYQTLLQMGDMEEAMKDDPEEFTDSYEQMKHLSVEQFKTICSKGIYNYRKDKKSSGLN